MEDGSAIRAADGQRDVQEGRETSEAEREARLTEAEGNSLEPGPEVLGVERAAPDGHGEPGDGERLEDDPDLREREEEKEDLDEDRGVSDDLDVDRRELADDRDAVCTCRAQDEPDDEGAGDRDGRDLSVRRRPARSSSPFSVTNDQSKAMARVVTAVRSGAAALCAAAPSIRDRCAPLRALPS